MASLPVIDYSGGDRASKAKQIVEVMETLGFLFIDNIPGYDEDEMRWCVEFFYDVMPAEKKLEVARIKYNPNSKKFYRGYFATNKVASSYKEGYEISQDLPEDDPDYRTSYPCSEHTPWPQAGPGEDLAPYKKFKMVMLRYFHALFDVSLELLRLISLGLGLNENYFDSLFTKHISTLRLINYPVHDFDPPEDAYTSDGKLISTAQHRDTSILTLLSTFDYEGLQVEREDGSWLDVIPRKNSLIVNIGAILTKMSNDQLKATIHRVLAIGRPRRSVVFFFEPSYHALLPNRLPKNKSMKSAADYPKDNCFEYGPYMVEFIQRFVEWKNFKLRTPEE